MTARRSHFRRSVFTRLALALIMLPALIFTLVSAASGWQTLTEMRREIVNQINDDMASLSEIHLDDGAAAVDLAITRRLDLLPLNRAGAHYRFETSGGAQRAGDLDSGTAATASLSAPTTGDSATYGPLTLRATVFSNGDRLVVARENDAIRVTTARLTRNYGLGLLALLAVSALVTFLSIGRLRRRIGAMNIMLDRIGQGHLDLRIPDAETPDEIGALTAHINAMIGRAERLLILRKRVTDQVAHEMRSPLTQLDAALMQAESGTRSDPRITKAREALNSSLRLLDGLLDVSSADAQQGDRRGFEPVDLAALSTDMVELFEPVAELRGHNLVLETDESCQVEGAPAQLGRLISNLLDNALKYADRDTEIRMDVRCSHERVVLNVSNRGPRILGDLRSEIFTPFYRHPDMADKQGHGLGLALCRAIATRHGGTLDVTPDPELTVFTLNLPRIEAGGTA